MFVNYWMYNVFLNIDGEKMFKLFGNFIMLYDVLKDNDLNVICFFMLFVYYWKLIILNDVILEDVKNGLEWLMIVY